MRICNFLELQCNYGHTLLTIMIFTGNTGHHSQNGSFIIRSKSIIFSYHRKHFHTMEFDKTMEIGFSNLFLQYFENISILWRRSNFPVTMKYLTGVSSGTVEDGDKSTFHMECSAYDLESDGQPTDAVPA